MLNWDQEYSHANFHVKHRFVYSTIWDLPFGRGRKLGSNMNQWSIRIVGNWQTNGILHFSVRTCIQPDDTGRELQLRWTVRPDLVAGKDPNAAPSGGRTPDQWFDILPSSAPNARYVRQSGELQNYRTRDCTIVDFGLFKDFPIN